MIPHSNLITLEGNEAVATIAHLTNEVIAIYPITPSSSMAELSDEWSSQGRLNLWGSVPQIIEMQSEAGAAAAVHGALQAGTLATTFTSSQGLLLMIPTMYKIAGELTPTVFHVAARSLAHAALSIFGDHGDVMAVRATGFALLSSCSPQEAMDCALIAQAATLEGRVPIVHFFDGFRTSHEVAKIEEVSRATARAMIDDLWILAHQRRALSPDHPVIRGTSQNPDVSFQVQEAVNPWYERMPGVVQKAMDSFGALTGRRYQLFEYVGAADANRIIILMGSGTEVVEETVNHLVARGEKVGMVRVRLYRPFSPVHLLAAIPAAITAIAVLDRTKEAGADGEPLYKDVVTAVAEAWNNSATSFTRLPRIVGGRYGLSSKEFTPAMVKGVFDELSQSMPKNHFTVGINDDVTYSSINYDPSFRTDTSREAVCAVFYGLGSDGTVSANKNTIKILGERMAPSAGDEGKEVIEAVDEKYAQGYFVYDSKKAGAITVSHLRFSQKPIRSPYLIGRDEAQFVGCHQPIFIERYDVLEKAAPGAVFLLNSPYPVEQVWDSLPRSLQQSILDKNIAFWAVDAYGVAAQTGMGRRINTVMQTCFFAISGVLPQDQAIKRIKKAVEKTYGKRSRSIVESNFAAIDQTVAALHKIDYPRALTSRWERPATVAAEAPEFVQRVTGVIYGGDGDTLPVSSLPVDGTWPVGTSRWEKRNLALEIPVWEEKLCIHCGKCPLICPHAAIRSKVARVEDLADAPAGFKHVPIKGKEFESGLHVMYQVAPEDCTGCGLCVEICPARDKSEARRKALNMVPQPPIRERERQYWDYFLHLPEYDRRKVKETTIKGAMLFQPLFEFSGACVGCGETPYIKLATQLFGDRMVIGNATGCSSIYGGNLPTTPYTTDAAGRGPTWCNSLFEDNAEFTLGLRVSIDKQVDQARTLLMVLRSRLDGVLVDALLNAEQLSETAIHEQRQRVELLKAALAPIDDPSARHLTNIADILVRKSVWGVGGDGWAYDIGFGGLDHVLALDRDVNLLVLDTEVYSNTGGQTSKSTPLGAVAKFAAAGKAIGKKNLALIAMAYGHVYVAQVALGAKDQQTLRAFLEAESYPGPSLILAYSPCIAHGVDMTRNILQQELAVESGHWPLFRYDPRRSAKGENPLSLDSKKPSIPYKDFITTETRFNMLFRSHPEQAERFLVQAQSEVNARFHYYEQLAGL
ncbi:putative pyruvate-flavodoxin oxidoreductase [Gammaproteobacteria bacterium]